MNKEVNKEIVVLAYKKLLAVAYLNGYKDMYTGYTLTNILATCIGDTLEEVTADFYEAVEELQARALAEGFALYPSTSYMYKEHAEAVANYVEGKHLLG